MSVGDRVFKNRAKLEAKVGWHLFSGHGVKSCATISSIDCLMMIAGFSIQYVSVTDGNVTL